MKGRSRKSLGRLAAAGIALLLAGAALASATPKALLTTVGATAIVYRGPQVDVALSYRFAKNTTTGNWLLLETSMTATATPIEIPRSAIAVRIPSGEVVPLAPQRLLSEDYSHLASTIARADVMREPLGYLTPRPVRQARLFSEYRPGLAFQSEWLDQWHNTYGRLFFRLPSGIQKGRYDLLINLPESKVAIPFTI